MKQAKAQNISRQRDQRAFLSVLLTWNQSSPVEACMMGPPPLELSTILEQAYTHRWLPLHSSKSLIGNALFIVIRLLWNDLSNLVQTSLLANLSEMD